MPKKRAIADTPAKARDVAARVQALGSPARAATSAWFFKTGPGQYGEGDVFVGVPVPQLRKLAREFRALPLLEVETLLQSPLHEVRLLALLILADAAGRADARAHKQIYDLYLANTARINNWDLVDSSAPYIVGTYLETRPRKPLYRLARSRNFWERRVSIVATQHFIRQLDYADTLHIAVLLLGDKEDLIHKATGWMLREVGKRDQPVLEGFLDEHHPVMPRTMLRYALEHFPAEQRAFYMGKRGRDSKSDV